MAAFESLLVPLGALVSAVTASLVNWYNGRINTGRLQRTADQVARICEISEKLRVLEDALASRPPTDSLRALIEESSKALRDDFKRERQILPRWTSTSSRFRSVLLAKNPAKRWEWPFRLVFHFLLMLPAFVALRGLIVGQWLFPDTIAVLVAFGLAILTRLFIAFMHRMTERGKRPA